MKKTLSFLVALCIAGLFSAKAQSASDSSFARDLSYTTMSGMPSVITDTLNNGKILKDLRIGVRAKGYAFSLSSTKIVKIRMRAIATAHFDTYLYLLDSTFTKIAENDNDNNGSTIIDTLTPGRYYIVATPNNRNITLNPFYISLSELPITTIPLDSLTYTPLGAVSDTTVYDTISLVSSPYIAYLGNNGLARGYSFQGTQNKFLDIRDSRSSSFYILMDSNHTVIKHAHDYLSEELPQTGTYYLVIVNYYYEYITKITNISIGELSTYYVNSLNGNDTNNGLTPATAFASLETALDKSQYVGKFYLTEDYTFSDYFGVLYAKIYPYGKDIRLFLPTSGTPNIVFFNFGTLILGEKDSNHYFIIDSSHGSFDNFVAAANYGLLEINNLKMLNSNIDNQSDLFSADNLIMRNCEFINDTFNNTFIDIISKSAKFINCNISKNFFGYGLMSMPDSLNFTMENTTVSGNEFDYNGWPQYFYGGATVNLTSGTWSRNYVSPFFPYQNNAYISSINSGGIWIEGCTVNIGADFTMDPNNYLCLDTATTVNISEDLSAPVVATLYPMVYDVIDGVYKSDYRTGRPMLSGSATLLANNFRKFRVAQADTVAWYLHSDGKIYTNEEPEPPVAINGTEEGTIRLYPNPASNVLNIALQGTEVNEVVVIDIYGKTAMRNTVADGNNSLDISSLPAGMYFVQLRADNAVKATQKLIKR